MRVFYCKKCKTDSPTPICDHCGAQITSLTQNERFKWRALRIPLGDTPTLLGAFRLLLWTVALLILVLFAGEVIVSPDKQQAMTMLTNSGILPWALLLLGAGAALILTDLALQGREEMHFVVDARGAHLQTWIEPTQIRCIARFVNYEATSITQLPDGSRRMLLSETHLLWNDVARCELRRHARRIDLYRPSSFRFMSLYVEEGEFDALLDYIKPKMKQLRKPGK